VAPGMEADLIAVEGNPVDDITSLQRVTFVMKAGRVYRNGREGSRLDRGGMTIIFQPSPMPNGALLDSIRATINRGGVVATVVRADSTDIPIARYGEVAPRVARLRADPAEIRIAVGDTLQIASKVRVFAVDGAGNSLGSLSTFDYTLVPGAAGAGTTTTRVLIGLQVGESIVKIAFPRALWPGLSPPPVGELKIIVR
jgi:hypothetical protein